MLVVSRFRVPEAEGSSFETGVRRALSVLSAQRGYRRARLGRAADDPTLWVLTSEWDGVGSWRRALSAYDVKVEVSPLLGTAIDEPSAFELLATDDGAAGHTTAPSRRAPDADTAAPGGPGGPGAAT